MAKKKKGPDNIAAQNRKARHDYFIEENYEAGIMLTGTEVKSLREGRATITEAYASDEDDGALYLINAYIPEYESARHFNHDPKRKRKLLLHKREIEKLRNAVNRKGMTLVALSIFFNERGMAKVDLGLAKGKQHHDKRQDMKDRDWKRDKARLMRAKG
ncbi:MAG: SsrA-binding protein SmpB [Rhodospirillales bacterium]|nr:SsrA-binding protein SmpB [Rhodospirillales bacterium]